MVSKLNSMMFLSEPMALGEGSFPTSRLKVDHFELWKFLDVKSNLLHSFMQFFHDYHLG